LPKRSGKQKVCRRCGTERPMSGRIRRKLGCSGCEFKVQLEMLRRVKR
jgi:ribosomal protein L40E